MSEGEGKGDNGGVGTFWNGVGGKNMLIEELVYFCDEEFQNSECYPCCKKSMRC